MAALVAPAAAQKNAQIQPVRDFEMESRHATSIALRDMPTVDVEPPFPHKEHEPLKRPLPANMRMTPAGPDRVAQFTPRALGATPLVGLNFMGESLGSGGFGIPPDSEGNIGLTQYVEFINSSYAVYDKKTGALIAGPIAGHVLFQALGANADCANTDDGDPIVEYDKAANRWILSQFSVANNTPTHPSSECIAVSTSSDATGTYHAYQFQYNNFPDYPKIGVWSDKWLVNYNMYQSPPPGGSPVTYVGDEVCALDRANMLAGNAANQACAAPNKNENTLLPSDLDGATAPPASNHGFFIGLSGTASLEQPSGVDGATAPASALDMYKVSSVNFSTGTLTLSGPTIISVPNFTFPCSFLTNGGFTVCVPQNDGGAQQIDTLGDRLMWRLAYRNMGTFETVLASHTVDVSADPNGQTGIRWYEIRNLGGTPTVFQTGTHAPDSNYRFMPSAAMDKSGDIAIGYSVGSSSLDPSIYFSTRAAGDPAGTLGNETVIVTGPEAQQGSSRWGDYSAMTVDPVDDCTLWYINQFIPSNGNGFMWATEIANFVMAGCGVSKLAITSAPGSAQAGVPFSITVKAEGPTGQTVPNYRGTVHFTSNDALAGLPADYTFTAADAGVHTFTVTLVSLGSSQTITVADANNSIVITAGQTTIVVNPGPAARFTVSASSPQIAGTLFNFTVTALDQFGNTATSYAGTVHFSSSDGLAMLPPNYTFIPADAGVHVFFVTLCRAGSDLIMATDTVTSSISGSGSVIVNPGSATKFALVVPQTAQKGTAFNMKVTAQDGCGNAATGYRGTVSFTSSAAATLPSNYTFTSGDAGVHVFAVTLNPVSTPTTQTVTVTDAGNSIAATSSNITVGTGDPTLHAVPRTIRIFRSTPQVIAGSFTDDDTSENGSNLSATIDWGDGSPTDTNATIVHVGGLPNLFNVLGSHTYNTKGRFTVTVTVTDNVTGGSTTIVTSTEQFGPRSFSF